MAAQFVQACTDNLSALIESLDTDDDRDRVLQYLRVSVQAQTETTNRMCISLTECLGDADRMLLKIEPYNYKKSKKDALMKMCTERDLSDTGTRQELIDRLAAFFAPA